MPSVFVGQDRKYDRNFEVLPVKVYLTQVLAKSYGAPEGSCEIHLYIIAFPRNNIAFSRNIIPFSRNTYCVPLQYFCILSKYYFIPSKYYCVLSQ